MPKITHLYRKQTPGFEYCFNIRSERPLSRQDLEFLKYLLAPGHAVGMVKTESGFPSEKTVEIGPRLAFDTPFSTHLVEICQNCGLWHIKRIERSRRLHGNDMQGFPVINMDRMTETEYTEPIRTFDTGIMPEAVWQVPLLEKGPDSLLDIREVKLDEWDREFLYQYFKTLNRNPTIVEIIDYGNSNSEHSRHGYFKAKQMIDGKEMPLTLMEIVRAPYEANPGNSVIAFHDNSSAIRGFDVTTIVPHRRGEPSPYQIERFSYHIIFTAETHNFPSGVAPFPGAETGTGGRLRDVMATGRGGFVTAGTAGYCVGALELSGYPLPWEEPMPHPENLASAKDIEIEASNGASDYGNKFGEPVIQGFTRSFDLRLANGERWAWKKPIMFTGGIGQIDDRLLQKNEPSSGMAIVQIGGPAYRVGFGGGAASSLVQGENEAALDYDAVQRGDAEMERKMYCVVRTCNEMGADSPIASHHDQGAGGPLNVLKEIVEEAGGWIDVRRINVGDSTMSVLDICVAEYQERNAFLIYPDRLEEFRRICSREKVPCEALGEVTGDGYFRVFDSQTGTTPVDWNLARILGELPQRTYEDVRQESNLTPLELPSNLDALEAFYWTVKQADVSCKLFLTNKVDRSVTGLIAQQQCCGSLQLPLADVAVVAQSHFGLTGAATAIGEQARKMLVDPKAGARMAVGEALTNLCWAGITGLEDTRFSANWMWAPKLPGEGAALYDAALGMREALLATGTAIDGGKDSLSMATKVDQETVKSPRQLVMSAYAPIRDITKAATPDIKRPGESILLFLDLAPGQNRLGGSALAHCFKQVGRDCPDMDYPELVKNGCSAVVELVKQNLVLAGHDRSDGGLAVTLAEMAFGGNCGLQAELVGDCTALQKLYSEELGLVLECLPENLAAIKRIMANYRVGTNAGIIGRTRKNKTISLLYNNKEVISGDTAGLRDWWHETCYHLELEQTARECARSEREELHRRNGPTYRLTFVPQAAKVETASIYQGIQVAILREEGCNGEREMAGAVKAAGMEPWDVTMTDLLEGRIDLQHFRMVIPVGGFTYADDPEAAKGWAVTLMTSPKLAKHFQVFYERPDTLSLGICNGNQLLTLLGWVPGIGKNKEKWPYLAQNTSGRFESRFCTLKINRSPAIMLKGMEGSILPIWSAHGEGKYHFPDKEVLAKVNHRELIPVSYVNDDGRPTTSYPYNPNGSPLGVAGLCSRDGRHLAMMPHPERTFRLWQWAYLPQKWQDKLDGSPWLQMFINARRWLEKPQKTSI